MLHDGGRCPERVRHRNWWILIVTGLGSKVLALTLEELLWTVAAAPASQQWVRRCLAVSDSSPQASWSCKKPTWFQYHWFMAPDFQQHLSFLSLRIFITRGLHARGLAGLFPCPAAASTIGFWSPIAVLLTSVINAPVDSVGVPDPRRRPCGPLAHKKLQWYIVCNAGMVRTRLWTSLKVTWSLTLGP